jgi:CRP-like cAMP-binding protein
MNNINVRARHDDAYHTDASKSTIVRTSSSPILANHSLNGFDQIFVAHGSTLASQGSPLDFAFYVLSGWVLEEEVSCDGEVAWADIILRGEVAGLNCVTAVSDQKRFQSVTTASLTALTDVFAVRVPRYRIDVRSDDDRGFARMIHETLRRQSSHLHDHLVALSARNANERVVLILKSLKKRANEAFGASRTDRLPVSQVVLARIANISVVHMNRIAQKLRQEGILDWSNEGVRFMQ